MLNMLFSLLKSASLAQRLVQEAFTSDVESSCSWKTTLKMPKSPAFIEESFKVASGKWLTKYEVWQSVQNDNFIFCKSQYFSILGNWSTPYSNSCLSFLLCGLVAQRFYFSSTHFLRSLSNVGENVIPPPPTQKVRHSFSFLIDGFSIRHLLSPDVGPEALSCLFA